MSSYGVVGLANTSKFDNWRKNLTQSGHNQPGVSVTISEDDTIVVDLYIIIEYGTRISEVAGGSVMHRVQYTLEQIVGLPVEAVNVHVQGLRISNQAPNQTES